MPVHTAGHPSLRPARSDVFFGQKSDTVDGAGVARCEVGKTAHAVDPIRQQHTVILYLNKAYGTGHAGILKWRLKVQTGSDAAAGSRVLARINVTKERH